MLQINNLSKTYGTQNLFSELSCVVNPGERVGLIGRNGYGKTTLFQMILGNVLPDSGNIVMPKGYRIGHLEQVISFAHPDALSEACSGLPAGEKNDSWKAKKILAGLGFAPEAMEMAPMSLSAGYQIRLNLAKAILSDPELLLLDEPNNYLDIVSIRWLVGFLRSWKKELLLITHDRSFMDSVTTHTMIIHRQKLRKFKGTTESVFQQIRHEEHIHEKTRLNFEKKRQKTEEYVQRFRAKARMAKSVQSTVKALEKQEQMVKLDQIKNLDFSFTSDPLRAASVMRVGKLSFSYSPGAEIISDFSLEVGNRDRICIVGKNGRGKTTLLKLLSGELTPASGEIKSHPRLKTGCYLESDVRKLHSHKTVCEEVMAASEESLQQRVREICGALMFEGDSALKQVSVLSGGEKSRVLLARVLASPCNLLLLDEPTNHLDLESCEALLSAAEDFDGAVIMITHNEGFLHRLAKRLVIFDESGIRVIEGTYRDFLEGGGWHDSETGDNEDPDADTPGTETPAIDRKELRRIEAGIRQERFRALNPLEKEIRKLEKKIAALEEEKAENNRLLIDAAGEGDGETIVDLSRKDRRLTAETEALYARLEEALELHSEKSASFEVRLNSLSS